MLSLRQLTLSLRMRKSPTAILDMMDISLPIHHHQTSPAGSSSATGSAALGATAFLYRTSRWLCLFTTCLAFLLGVGVGVAVPLWYSPIINQNLPSAAPVAPVVTVVPVVPVMPVAAALFNRSASWAPRRPHKSDSGPSSNSINSAEAAGRVSFVEAQEPAPWASSDEPNRTSGPAAAETVTGDAVNGVFWSGAVEELLPAGFDESDAEKWRQLCRHQPLVRLEEGCGRMQNRLVTFENGTRSCCRYRQNYDQIQGEIFSYYLSRLLGLPNLPPSTLGLVKPLEPQWSGVRSQLSLAQWAEDRPVVYTQFLEDLEPAYIPAQLRGADRHLNPQDVRDHRLEDKDQRSELVRLAQWSDLLVLDYLTANLDRMVNNLYNMQWNPAMMDAPAHNLAVNRRTGLLVFLDNESGLLHGYRLLDKYESYHKSMLDSVCLFRRGTVDALRRLQERRDVGDLLRRRFESRDGHLVDYLPFLPEKSVKTLNHRIDRVLDQVAKCQTQYGAL